MLIYTTELEKDPPKSYYTIVLNHIIYASARKKNALTKAIHPKPHSTNYEYSWCAPLNMKLNFYEWNCGNAAEAAKSETLTKQ